MTDEYGTPGNGVKAREPSPSLSVASTREDGGMSRFSRDLAEVLLPAVEAGREALADLDSKEVPASLRRVAAYSGGRLPPPLARSLLEALDRDDWLREKAVEKMPEDTAAPAATAFLQRDDGWWRVVAEQLAKSRAASAGTAAAEAEAAADGLAEQLDVAKDRLRKAGADLEQARARARRKRSKARTPEAAKENLRKARSRLQEMESELAAAVAEREEAEAMIARLRSRVRKEAREQRRREETGSPRRSFGGGPVEMARTLDLMAAAAPHRGEPEPGDEEARSTSGLELPPGVRPDARDAIDWLAARDEPITLIVDGYNVLYTVDPGSFTTGRSRHTLAGHLARLRRSAGTVRVAVVYDSNLPGDREERMLPGGVEVHFSDEDRLADDEIVDLVAAAKGRVVVVTSDRDLRERAEARGALALWSEALADWMAPRAT